jgi:hypothetical protein
MMMVKSDKYVPESVEGMPTPAVTIDGRLDGGQA